MVVQEYIDKPYLIDGYKFDLRVYILMTSCDPLRIFLFNDGLVRMSTEPYSPPTEGNIVSTLLKVVGFEKKRLTDPFGRKKKFSAHFSFVRHPMPLYHCNCQEKNSIDMVY